jgi:hypothetical protein
MLCHVNECRNNECHCNECLGGTITVLRLLRRHLEHDNDKQHNVNCDDKQNTPPNNKVVYAVFACMLTVIMLIVVALQLGLVAVARYVSILIINY